jgi:hypothetical protein
MKLGGVLVFAGWKLSDAVRYAELRGCDVIRAWPHRGAAHVEALYEQRVADGLAVDAVEGTIAITSARGEVTAVLERRDLSA